MLFLEIQKRNKPRTHHLFRSRNAWINVRLTYLEVLKQVTRYGWCFSRPNDSMKSKGEAFSCHKQRRKVPLVHSQLKQHQDRCGWSIYELKNHKMLELSYWQANKQLPTYSWSFEMFECLKNCINCVFRACKPTTKVQRMYLAFQNFKINCK